MNIRRQIGLSIRSALSALGNGNLKVARRLSRRAAALVILREQRAVQLRQAVRLRQLAGGAA